MLMLVCISQILIYFILRFKLAKIRFSHQRLIELVFFQFAFVSRVAKNGKTTVLRKTNAFLFLIQHFASLEKTDPSWGVYKEFESGANKQILF